MEEKSWLETLRKRILEDERERLLQPMWENVHKEQEEQEKMNEEKVSEKCTRDVLKV